MSREFFAAGPKQISEKELRSKNFDIAVLSKDLPFHRRLTKGFCDEIGRRTISVPRVSLAPAGMAWNEAYETMKRIALSNPDAIVTVGALCSQVARYVLNELKLDIPQFFGGVDRPDFLGLVSTPENHHRTTGVSAGQPLYMAHFNVLSLLRPMMKHLLITYCVGGDSGGLANAAALGQQYYVGRNVKVTIVPFYPDESPIERIRPFLKTVDTLTCFEGCNIQSYKDSLVKECKRRGIVIFASTIEMIAAGAPLGYVADSELTGKALAGMAFNALWLDIPFTALPITYLGSNARRVAINNAATAELGLTFDEALLCLCKSSSVYGDVLLGEAGILRGELVPEQSEINL